MEGVWLPLQFYWKEFWCWIIVYWHGVAYEIKSENIYEFFQWKDLFDFSNYPKDSTFFNETNKKMIAKMKGEFGGVIVDELVGLKSRKCSIQKLMIVIQQKEWVLRLRLINLKMLYLVKKVLDTKWKEFKATSSLYYVKLVIRWIQ